MKKIKIGDTPFMVKIIDDAAGMKKGLSNIKKLSEGRGLLFDFKEPTNVTMNMYDMNFPLDMIFINDKMIVTKVARMEPGDNVISVDDTVYVLEVNQGEGLGLEGQEMTHSEKNMIVKDKNVSEDLKEKFKQGGSFKLREEEVKAVPGAMHILDDTGKVLMNIKGGERIFSIKHTEELVDLANKVKMGRVPADELGKKMQEILNIQDNQKPEYVN